MKFVVGAPPKSSAVNEEHGMSALKWNPSHMAIATTFLSVAFYVGAFLLWPIGPNIKFLVQSPMVCLFGGISIVAATIFVHELLHLLSVPRSFSAKTTVLGFNPRKFMFYAFTDVRMSKADCIRFSLLPFVVLTCIPFAVVYATGRISGWWEVVAISNAAVSSLDVVFAAITAFKIPTSQSVHLEMDGIYYR